MPNNAIVLSYSADSLEELATALVEGGRGIETSAGLALVMWPGHDCPWFEPMPSANGTPVHPYIEIEEYNG